MFPNVRLMIVAVLASMAALSCGFGVFAAFRVNHAPLARVASTAAPLQLVIGNPVPLAATVIAAATPVVYQAPLSANPAAREMLPAPAPAPSPPAQTAAAPVTPAAEDQGAPPHEEEAETAPTPAAPTLASSQDASPEDAAQETPMPDAQEVTSPPNVDEPPAEPAPATASTAAVEPPAAPTETAEETQVASEPAPAITTSEAVAPPNIAAKTPVKTAAKRAKKSERTRVAKTHITRRLYTITFADNSSPAYLSAQSQFQTASQFQSAPPAFQEQTVQTRLRARRIKISARKAAKKHSAVGGPFVGSPTP